jgi:hypothetical protein
MDDGELQAKVLNADGDEAVVKAHKLADLLTKASELVKSLLPDLPPPAFRSHRRFA